MNAIKWPIPPDMVEVSEAKFFEIMNPKNVHPRPEPGHSSWCLSADWRHEIGRSYPGYRCKGPDGQWTSEEAYAVVRRLA